MSYDVLTVIGRFQPFHLGHRHVVASALPRARHVVALIGSPNLARSIRNPFTFEERAEMVRATFPAEIASGRLVVRALDDYAYNDTAWIAAVQREVERAVRDIGNAGDPVQHGLEGLRAGIIGHAKAASSHYQRLFPEWDFVAIDEAHGTFDASEIRADYLRRAPCLPRDRVPEPVAAQLDRFRLTDAFERLVAEADWLADYRKSWAGAPFTPIFVTVDCVVQQAGFVLLVERGQQPGKGLLALPGGFIEPNETLRQSAIRELREETAIADAKGPIPPAMLASFIEDKATRVFDAPDRSVRGRVITNAFLFRCPDRPELFKVKGGDDAVHASWHRLADLDPRRFLEDHWFILQAMLGI